jgi:hypothetical protein
MKNVLIFLATAVSTFAQTINTTAPIKELEHYGVDFTDTDNDGMTDVAERRYGFDPNDPKSFPSKDYTILSGDTPRLHASTGPTDPKNEIRFEFTESEYITNRAGNSNLDTLANNREFLNLAMPILLHELGPPPNSFVVKISCQNRGVYANGHRISVNDDSRPQSFLHELGHVWKDGWTFSFMKLRGGRRSYMRGFEEGFSEALTYIISNKFAEAYPNHPYVKDHIAVSKNAQTWRGNAYNFDVTMGEDSFQGGTFWRDKFTEYRYENSAAAFTVLANQRDGVFRDMFRVFYEEAEANPSWDWTLNSQDIFNVWEQVLPTINGVDTSEWLTNTGLLNGTPAPQRLYVSIIDYRVYLLYPDTQGNFSWSYDPNILTVQNIPSWFPTKEVGGKIVPNVESQPFNVELDTIYGESVTSVSKKLSNRGLGETSLFELYPTALPIGLYKTTIEFPNFKEHTDDYVSSAYVIGTKHVIHSKDELTIHVGVDIPTANRVQMHINDLYYESNFTNGLAVFRFGDIGIDYSGPIEILVSDGNAEKTYKRAVSHFGTRQGQRLNEFLIVDRDFDNIEDAFDSSVVSLTTDEFVRYTDISKNSVALANHITRRVSRDTRPKPPVPGKPTTPPMITNPIEELELKIKELESNIVSLTNERNKLVSEKSLLGVENENLKQKISVDTKTITELENVVLANKLDMSLILARVVSLEASLASLGKERNDLVAKVAKLESENLVLNKTIQTHKSDNSTWSEKIKEQNQEIQTLTSNLSESNETIIDLNKTIVDLSSRISLEQNESAKLTKTNSSLSTENSKLKEQVLLLQTQFKDLQSKNSTLVATNEGLNNTTLQLRTQVDMLTRTNTNLTDSLATTSAQVTQLTTELEEAIRVAQIPFTSGWFYDPEDGWLYTDANVFPLVYKHETSDWHFYELGSHDPRYFYSYETDEWHEWK